MSTDRSLPRSRRALLGAALGAMTATFLAAIGGRNVARADTGDPLLLGKPNNQAGATTTLNQTALGKDGLTVVATGATGSAIVGQDMLGIGIKGSSESGFGVTGIATGAGFGVFGRASSRDGDANHGVGVKGLSDGANGVAVEGAASDPTGNTIGVYGFGPSPNGIGTAGVAPGTGVVGLSGFVAPAVRPNTGVYGNANQDATAKGVWGDSPLGHGVHGTAVGGVGVSGSAADGTALDGTATTGYALRTSGRVRLERCSGIASIAAGRTSVTLKPGVEIGSAAFVLLTPRSDPGAVRLWYTLNAAADTITIRASEPAATELKVGWLLLG